MAEEILFCKNGGCTAKLGAGLLRHVLEKLPKTTSEGLLVGYDTNDDGAVYQLTEEIAVIETLDFFPPMVEDPFLFGQIAAANALSDVYAMGGEVKAALNIVSFPEEMDLNILGKILQGGAEKVREAGGALCGGHSIHGSDVLYGLSVTGIVDPKKIRRNTGCQPKDCLILTKPLGTGVIMAANRLHAAPQDVVECAVKSMTRLNRDGAEAADGLEIHSCTDVTGFGLAGHLLEMVGEYAAVIFPRALPVFPGALDLASDFYLTGAGQKNRNFAQDQIEFCRKDFALEEILFDPQTSGGLLFAAPQKDSEILSENLKKLGLACEIIGEVTDPSGKKITVL
ncbi:MAG: selenide, water dikinase SelD [Clostridiales bacterium]|nr:selenide, water dikinase SelD [Clostridiales bacterium]